MIRDIHTTLASLSSGAEVHDSENHKPAVPIKKSITPEHIFCLEDGKPLKMLKRYLRSRYDLTPEAYRLKWGLAANYPMVAPNYAKQRSQFANELLVTELLPVLDNLERALAMDTATDATSLRSGVELTARMFAEVLVRFGVKPIQAAGQLFDPTKHEAIAQEESAEHAEGTVIEELQRGYLLHDRVIRPSMVRVASAASANASRQEVES